MTLADNFKAGMRFVVDGGLHHGHTVTIVEPMTELMRARAEAKKTGRKLSEGTTYRPGLVAAFDPAFPETLWWWFAPHQLERIEQ